MSTPLLPGPHLQPEPRPRKYTPGKRRLSIYWTWSYPWEAQRDPDAMDNRFSTMTEVRKVLWPTYETPEWSSDAISCRASPARSSCSIARR